METTLATQLKELKDEIKGLSEEILLKEERRDGTADGTEKAIILESIKVLYSYRSALRATRDYLIRNPVTTTSGKNTPSRR